MVGKNWDKTKRLFMWCTKEVSIKIIEITAHMTARVTSPRVRIWVEASVKKVQSLVGINNITVCTGCTAAAATFAAVSQIKASICGGLMMERVVIVDLVTLSCRTCRPTSWTRRSGSRPTSSTPRQHRGWFAYAQVLNLWIVIIYIVMLLLLWHASFNLDWSIQRSVWRDSCAAARSSGWRYTGYTCCRRAGGVLWWLIHVYVRTWRFSLLRLKGWWLSNGRLAWHSSIVKTLDRLARHCII